MSSGARIELAGITKRFGRTLALDAVDLAIGPGVTGLLGPNGAGKTTLLRILATVLAPDHGTYLVDGTDPRNPADRLALRRRLGYLPQEPGFHAHFTAFELVDYLAVLKEWAERRPRHDEVRRVLGLVGLQDAGGTQIRHLSGGMRRRVGIAQALLGRPDLVVLDEPTTGLDPAQRLRFRELLGTELAGSTILLSTHLTDDVAALCQHVVVLLEGSVRFAGTPAALAALASGRVWLAAGRDPGARLAWTTASGEVRNVGEPPAGAAIVEPTVEDGYLLLTGADQPVTAA